MTNDDRTGAFWERHNKLMQDPEHEARFNTELARIRAVDAQANADDLRTAPDPRAWLDQVDARTNAATDGPWDAYNDNEGTVYSPFWCVANDAFHNPPDDDTPWIAVEVHTGIQADAEFIASARTDLPAATTALRAVLDLLDQVEGEDEWALVHTDDIRAAITTALEDA